YINYARELVPVFEELRFLPADKPVWRAHDAAAMRRCAAEIVGALPRAGEFGRADLIDRLCERLILETLIGYIAPPAAEREKSVRGARAYIENHYREAIVFDELALDYGMSPSAFRRKWKELMPIPPAKYAMQLRIREACRLLAETGMKIGDVAREVGFADRLYFARCFRRAMGETASSYRAHCRRRGPFETGAGGAEGGASQGDLPGRGRGEESRRDRPRGEWPGAPQSRRAHGRKCKALERLRDRRAPGVYPPAPCEQDGH
ncbi:MAG: helix-turn-helix transcriptional regulator, partial [Planctomycetota bacterium]|nr:helix-turn-helix transcriptional regulator [Planctomycetota bacterium]